MQERRTRHRVIFAHDRCRCRRRRDFDCFNLATPVWRVQRTGRGTTVSSLGCHGEVRSSRTVARCSSLMALAVLNRSRGCSPCRSDDDDRFARSTVTKFGAWSEAPSTVLALSLAENHLDLRTWSAIAIAGSGGQEYAIALADNGGRTATALSLGTSCGIIVHLTIGAPQPDVMWPLCASSPIQSAAASLRTPAQMGIRRSQFACAAIGNARLSANRPILVLSDLDAT